MTIILFLIDTSASMNQRTYLGARPTLLDVAKDAVEKFLKLRQRDSASRGDRYMLLTFEDPPSNIKAGWKEHHNVFMNELKNLTANGLTSIGPAIKNSLDLLNLNRMQTGIDTYGQGRCPFFLEPSIIIVITDGGKLTSLDTVQEFSLPRHSSVPGSELTKEPFRWDQRLFALVLRLTGTPPTDHIVTNGGPNISVPCDISRVDAICEVTGGRSYSVSSQRSLMQCLESVVQKIQGGVVIHFEKVGPDPPPIIPSEEEEPSSIAKNAINGGGPAPNGFVQNHSVTSNVNNIIPNNSSLSVTTTTTPSKPNWHSCRKLIYVQRSAQKGYSVGHWPIPESFWPDLNSPALPPRTAHPIVKFTCTNSDFMVIENLPFDKYELEPSPLTQYILSRKQPNVAWQCFVANSHKSSGEIGLPFGYLKASTNLSCVNLFVLPYNYPMLLPLLDDLFKVHHCKPTREWKAQFDNYLKNMPLYYAPPLKRALSRMGVPPNLVPDNMENCLSFSVLNYLKRLKNQAKAEFDKIVISVGTGKPMAPSTIKVLNTGQRLVDLALSNKKLKSRFSALKNELNEFSSFSVRLRDKNRDAKAQCYRNPYDITRFDLVDQIQKMRLNFLQPPGLIKFQDEDQLHSLPISQMGNYQEYLKKMPLPLRELESAPVRQHMFGNPFKIDKRGMMVDEADIDGLVNGQGSSSPMRSPKRPASGDSAVMMQRFKRKPGPIPRDFVITRPYTSGAVFSSPPPSPAPSSPASIDDQTPPPSSPLIIPTEGDRPARPMTPIPSSPPPFITTSASGENLQQSPFPIAKDIASVASNHQSYIDTDSTASLESVEFKVQTNQENSAPQNNNALSSVAPVATSQRLVTTSPTITPTVEPINGRINSLLTTAPVNNRVENTNGPTCNNVSTLKSRYHLSVEEIELRRNLFKLVRRPGKNYEPLVIQLSRLKGPLREYLLHEVVEEASRFKRKSLIDYLKQKLIESKGTTTVNGRSKSVSPSSSTSPSPTR